MSAEATTITANGTSSVLTLPAGTHFVGAIGSFGGGTCSVQIDLGYGFFQLKNDAADIVFTSANACIVPGPSQVRAVVAGATNPNLTFYTTEIPKT